MFRRCKPLEILLALKISCTQIDGVDEVHDLHVWALTPGIPLLAVHLNLSPGADGGQVLRESTEYCRSLGIDHTTIQVIKDGVECCGQNTGGGGGSGGNDNGAEHGHGPQRSAAQPHSRQPFALILFWLMPQINPPLGHNLIIMKFAHRQGIPKTASRVNDCSTCALFHQQREQSVIES